ncbi:MAG: hypothetical protein KC503_32860 [Myxococcales bacterium]|nr:hypothetical protein [Myxococcales bacterium]
MTRPAATRAVLLLLALLCAGVGCSDSTPPPPDARAPDAGSDATGPCAALCTLARIAGEPSGGHADGDAKTARFGSMVGLAGDATWVYVADRANALLRRVRRADGEVETIAGALRQRGPDRSPRDSSAAEARFAELGPLALLGDKLFVGDGSSLRVVDLGAPDRHVSAVRDAFNIVWGTFALRGLSGRGDVLYIGTVEEIFRFDVSAAGALPQRVAGDASNASGARDGSLASARFGEIRGIALGADASTLYVIERCAVRLVDFTAQTVSTLVGQLSDCSAERRDGLDDEVRFFDLRAISASSDDVLFVADVTSVDRARLSREQAELGVIRRIERTSNGVRVSTAAGVVPSDQALTGDADGVASRARLVRPAALWSSGAAADEVLIGTPSALRRLWPARDEVETLCGRLDEDGLLEPGPLLAGSADEGTFVALRGRGELGRIDDQQRYATLAAYDAREFDLLGASGIARVGDAIFVSGLRGVMRRDIASKTSEPLFADVVLQSGGMLLADNKLHWLHRTLLLGAPTPLIAVIDAQGGSQQRLEALGLARIYGLARVAKDYYAADGTVLARLSDGKRIVDEIAGKRDEPGCADGPASSARFSSARALASDGQGRLFIGDIGCNAVRVYDLASREVSTLVGKAGDGELRVGPLDSARLAAPSYLWWDAARGVLLIADPIAGVVLEVTR